jgi:hypothetical protein
MSHSVVATGLNSDESTSLQELLLMVLDPTKCKAFGALTDPARLFDHQLGASLQQTAAQHHSAPAAARPCAARAAPLPLLQDLPAGRADKPLLLLLAVLKLLLCERPTAFETSTFGAHLGTLQGPIY